MPATTMENAYDLSPMQLGMLYHSLESQTAGMYCIQVSYEMRGPLDPRAFVEAWQRVADRHAALRTSFHWRGGEKPYQVVHPRVEIPIEIHDWRALDPSVQEARLAATVRASSRRGFELDRPPLLRLTLARCGETSFRLLLAHHHLLLDGWCKPLLFGEVFQFYRAVLSSETLALPEPRPYRDYVEWLGVQDLSRAERFWRSELSGFSRPTPLTLGAAPGEPGAPGEEEYSEVDVEMGEAATERLRLYARRHRLTLNTIVLAAWGLVLGHTSGEEDVVFGATVNGRPASFSGAESIIGLFINTLPVRLELTRSMSLVDWLAKIQIRQARARDYDYTPLTHIQRWNAMPGGQRLFESIVVFENNPGFGREWERYGDIEIGDVRASVRNSLPLTLRSVPGRTISFQLLYDGRRFSRPAVELVAKQITTLLSRLAEEDGALVGDKLSELGEIASQHHNEEARAYEITVLDKLRNARGARRV